MENITEFIEFPKIYRVSRPCIITEKIDGTNGQICITEDGQFVIGSRSRWITPQNDNHGFAQWAIENKTELLKLGVGRHYGEWWGQGIQRGYGLKEKRFSLFNCSRWFKKANDNIPTLINNQNYCPDCCHVVPILYEGMFDTMVINAVLNNLRSSGSIAAPGFMRPEGIVCFHIQGNFGLKKTLEKDEEHKGNKKI